jgi:hypothetical protein
MKVTDPLNSCLKWSGDWLTCNGIRVARIKKIIVKNHGFWHRDVERYQIHMPKITRKNHFVTTRASRLAAVHEIERWFKMR